MQEVNKKKIEKIVSFILVVFIIVWFIPFINKGLDIQDTSSYLTKFKYIFDREIWVNELYYFFGELVGGIIYNIVPAYHVMVLNVILWIVYTITSFLIYYILKDYMPRPVLLLCSLVGSFFGITWVHCLNWNAISMLLQSIGIIVLVKALKEDKNKLIIWAGFIFGINTYVRIPNILQLIMVVIVFWNYMIKQLDKDGIEAIKQLKSINWKVPFVKSLWFALGGLIAGIIGALITIYFLGFDKFVFDLMNLFGVSGGSESTHGIVRILSLFYRGMLQGGGNWLKLIVVVALGTLIFFAGNKISKISGKDIKGYEITICVLVMVIFGLMSGYRADFIDAHVLAAFGAVIFGTVAAIYYAVKDRHFSNLCAMCAAATAILTIGTDNGSAYYRVYLGLPIAIVVCILIRLGKEKNNYIKMALNMAAGFALSFTLAAGFHYATTFVYHDSDNEYLVQEINNPQFKGIKTSVERAEYIDRLEELLEPYEDYKLMTLGSFNIGYVITDMLPFYNSSWPDLEYLSFEEFEKGIKNAKETGEYPVIVLADLEQDMSGYWNKDKYYMALEFANSDVYEMLYEDQWYAVYVPVENVSISSK